MHVSRYVTHRFHACFTVYLVLFGGARAIEGTSLSAQIFKPNRCLVISTALLHRGKALMRSRNAEPHFIIVKW